MNGTDVIQVLLNLTVNAFQCAPQAHSVDIEGRVLPQALDLTAFKDGPQDRLLNVENFDNTAPLLMLSVRDDGPGIPPETLPKIFQAYFYDQRRAARHRPGIEHRPAPHQGGQGRLARPHEGRRGDELHGLPSGGAARYRLARCSWRVDGSRQSEFFDLRSDSDFRRRLQPVISRAMVDRSRTAITYRYECWRALSAGVIEAAGTIFLLLIAVRYYHAGPLAKAMIAGGGSVGLILAPWVVSRVEASGWPVAKAAARLAAVGAG